MAATISWQIPATSVDNSFSVTLVSDQVLTGVTLDDFVLRPVGESTIEANTVATLTNVAGTNNWRLDVTLTGTYDTDFVVRLRPNRVTDADGDSNARLDSNAFRVDSSLTAPDAPTNLSITPSETTAAGSFDASADDGGLAVSDHEYAVETGSSLSASPTWVSTGSTTTSFTIPSLVADTEYTAAVRAVNPIGESNASDSVTFTTTAAAATVVTGYQIQVYDKNYKTQSGTDGTLARTLTHAVSIRIQRDLNRPKTLTFQVPRKGDDADAIEIGKVVRVIDGTDVVASFVIAGPLDKTRPLVTVNALGKEEILNWSITPWDFKLESSTAADQIAELLKNYRFFRQNTEDQFNDGTHDTTEVTSVAESTTETNYFVTLTQTGEDYDASGTFISQPILLTDDFLGDPADITRLRYVARLGNDTDIEVEFRHSNNDTDDTPNVDADWSGWSNTYGTSSDSETQQQLGITGYSVTGDFRWVQVRFTLTTSDVSITPALQAFEVVAEYPSEISAGSISLAGDALDETFSFKSHLSAIQRIVAARNAEFRVNDDYTLDVKERFGVTVPTVAFVVHDNCEVVRFQQQDRRLSTEIWSLGSTGSGLTQPFKTSASESATEAYGSRPWIYSPNATTETARTQEIADELALRDTPTNAVVIEETDTTESIEVGDLVSFEYTERSIDTTLRVIAITVADPRLGTPRQIELISDEGFFASQAEAIAGVTTGVTGGVTSAEAVDLDILEWGYFQPVDVFVDDTGAFSGSVLSSVDENLNNPSDADVVIAVVSHSSSLGSVSINANNDLVISVTGLSANVSANVVISATGTIGGEQRVVEQEINIRLVFNTVDLDGYVTDGAITGFVTEGVTEGLATDDDVVAATDGLVTVGVTEGLATDDDVVAATDGLVEDSEITEFITGADITEFLTDADIADFVTAGVTDGLVEDSEITEFVTGGVTDGLATDADVVAATDGLVTAGVTDGLATDADVVAATDGLVTAGVTDGLPTDADIADFVTAGVTDGLVEDSDITGFVTAGVTDGLATDSDIADFVTAGVTDGLPTDADLTAATSGLVTAGVTDGLPTDAELTAATQGLATDAELTAATQGLASDSDLTAATSGLPTDADLTSATSGLPTDSDLTAATSGLPTDADLTAATQGLPTDADLTAATDGLASETYVNSRGFVTAGVTDGLPTDAELAAATQGLPTDADLTAATQGLPTDADLTAATQGLPTDADLTAATQGLPTDADLTAATQGLPTDADLTAATQGLPTDADLTAATQGLPTDADLTAATQGLPTDAELAAATQGLPTDADVIAATQGLPTDADVIAATQGLPTDADVIAATQGLPTDSELAAATQGLPTDAELAAATQGLPTDADLTAATQGLPTDAELIAATQGFPTDAELTAATSGLPTDAELIAATSGLPTDADLTSATSGLVTDSELTAATSGLPTDADLTTATDGLATETYVDNAISDFITEGVTDGLATDADLTAATSGLPTDADLTAATSGLPTDAELTSATSGLVTAGVTSGFLDSEGFFTELAGAIGSVNAVLGTGIPYFNFYIDYDNELININQDLLAVQMQTILDRLQGVENNVSSLTGRVLTLES